MEKNEKLKIQLTVDYNKLLAYLAGGLLSFFTLFQLLTEVEKNLFLPKWMLFIISSAMFSGVFLFTYAAYLNFKEILYIENKLGLNIFKSSKIFSVNKGNEKSVSLLLKIIMFVFLVVSLIISLFINRDVLSCFAV